MDEGEWKVEWKTDDLYTVILKIYYTLYIIKLKICTQRFYYSSNWKYVHNVFTILLRNFQGLFRLSLLFFMNWPVSVSLLKEKWKICPKLIELLSWNGPTVHVCCFMLARASTKTFVGRVQKQRKNLRYPKNSLAGSLVSRGINVFMTLFFTTISNYVSSTLKDRVLVCVNTDHYGP